MQIVNESDLIEVDNWYFRIREPENKSSGRVLLLLHGWSGDENSMWVFTKDIPRDYWVISPRAPYSAGVKGYSWRNASLGITGGFPQINDFKPTLEYLVDSLGKWAIFNTIQMRTLDLIGFSQGAALVCVLLLCPLINIEKAACLAGFMPDGGKEIATPGKLNGKKLFVSHGIGDEIIPLNKSQEMVEILKYAGAEVDSCAEDVGHKVGPHCFKGLKKFFSNEILDPEERFV